MTDQRCPTCGSDDPTEPWPVINAIGGVKGPCSDPWHQDTGGEDTGGLSGAAFDQIDQGPTGNRESTHPGGEQTGETRPLSEFPPDTEFDVEVHPAGGEDTGGKDRPREEYEAGDLHPSVKPGGSLSPEVITEHLRAGGRISKSGVSRPRHTGGEDTGGLSGASADAEPHGSGESDRAINAKAGPAESTHPGGAEQEGERTGKVTMYRRLSKVSGAAHTPWRSLPYAPTPEWEIESRDFIPVPLSEAASRLASTERERDAALHAADNCFHNHEQLKARAEHAERERDRERERRLEMTKRGERGELSGWKERAEHAERELDAQEQRADSFLDEIEVMEGKRQQAYRERDEAEAQRERYEIAIRRAIDDLHPDRKHRRQARDRLLSALADQQNREEGADG